MRSYENIVPCRIAIYSVIIDVLNSVKHSQTHLKYSGGTHNVT